MTVRTYRHYKSSRGEKNFVTGEELQLAPDARALITAAGSVDIYEGAIRIKSKNSEYIIVAMRKGEMLVIEAS